MTLPARPATAAPVLVVDDDQAVRTLFVSVLGAAGLPAVAAGSGHEALEVIASRRISAVLLDNSLPDATGPELLRQLRDIQQAHTLPVIIVTGADDLDRRVSALEAGADDYLTKPVHVQELIARVRAQLRGQAEWLGVLEQRVGERNHVVTELTRERAGRTPAETADRICGHLTALPALDAVCIVAFIGDSAAIPLAVRGAYGAQVRIGRPLPPAIAQHLRERAASGPWSERRSDVTAGGTTASMHPKGAIGETTWAPLRTCGLLLGVLGITGSNTAGDVAGRSLSLAIDASAIAAALLAPSLESWSESRMLRTGIEQVVDQGAFSTVFQPIVRLDTMRVIGHEALTRFSDGADPELRFAEASQVGLGVSLEIAAIDHALSAARELPAVGLLGLNISPIVLTAYDQLGAMLARSDRPVVLELTEHDRIDDYPSVRRAVDRLGSRVQLSVDDAGSGYACLTHVLALRPAYMKLDRGWVQGIDADPARQALVAGLRHFARRTGCRLVAEGIESPEQLYVLRTLDVELGQGYLLGHPEPASQNGNPVIAQRSG